MHFTTKWETRIESITWRQNQSHHEFFTTMNAAEEQGRRATAQIFYNYQQWLHKQHCSSHLPGESITSVHSSHSCYPRQRINVFTPLKKQAIYYHLLILNMMPCERNTDSMLCLNTFLWIVIFAGLIYLYFSVSPFFYVTIQNRCAIFSIY